MSRWVDRHALRYSNLDRSFVSITVGGTLLAAFDSVGVLGLTGKRIGRQGNWPRPGASAFQSDSPQFEKADKRRGGRLGTGEILWARPFIHARRRNLFLTPKLLDSLSLRQHARQKSGIVLMVIIALSEQ